MLALTYQGLFHFIVQQNGCSTEWQMKREMLSPAYTTRWSDIPAAKLA
nr:DUF4113 domain-containing protein [Escherichia coli]